MPIHLPPVSRRRFISRLLCGASALSLPWPLLAKERSRDPDAFALFSDTHIAADNELVTRGVKMSEHLRKAVSELLELNELPSAVLVCGDCAFGSGQTDDYARLEGLVRPLREAGMPLHLALGNHDHRERFYDALAWTNQGVRRPVHDKHVHLLRSPRANWFILDSLETTASTPGLLGKEQLEWLAGSLDANADKPALVMVHHNPGLTGNLGLKDTVALLDALRPRRHVKAYFFGHTHVWNVETDTSGLHLVNLPAVAYVFKQGEPSGWVNARLDGSGANLEFHAMDRTHKAHGTVTALKWRES